MVVIDRFHLPHCTSIGCRHATSTPNNFQPKQEAIRERKPLLRLDWRVLYGLARRETVSLLVAWFMTVSCHGHVFRITGPLWPWKETTGHRWIRPVMGMLSLMLSLTSYLTDSRIVDDLTQTDANETSLLCYLYEFTGFWSSGGGIKVVVIVSLCPRFKLFECILQVPKFGTNDQRREPQKWSGSTSCAKLYGFLMGIVLLWKLPSNI